MLRSSCSFGALQRGVATQSLYGYQQGRFFVALSLEEAQHLRAALHRLGDQSAQRVNESSLNELSKSCLALRCLGPSLHGRHGFHGSSSQSQSIQSRVLAAVGDPTVLSPRHDLEAGSSTRCHDGLRGFRTLPLSATVTMLQQCYTHMCMGSLGSGSMRALLQVAEHCFHFANCDDMPRSQLHVLLRAVRAAEPEKRLRPYCGHTMQCLRTWLKSQTLASCRWWQDLRRCRRRTRESWQRRSLQTSHRSSKTLLCQHCQLKLETFEG